MPHVVVEVDASLRSLLPRRDRGDRTVRDAAPTETVAHVLQILGVPLTEVGDASVDGRKVRCDGLLEGVPAAEVTAGLEPGTRRTYNSFSRCTSCGQVYWRGAHGPRLESLVRRATNHG